MFFVFVLLDVSRVLLPFSNADTGLFCLLNHQISFLSSGLSSITEGFLVVMDTEQISVPF